MKYCFLIIAILCVFSACSSNTNQNPNSAKGAAVNSNAANANSLAATNSNPPGMQPYGGVQNLNPNAFNATNDNLKVIPIQKKVGELPYGSRNAPDDSVITTASRGREFIETRSFKNHAVLNKVEKILDGDTTKYKVYLKSGKVLDAPAEKMTNFTAMAPVNILSAAGIEPKTPANPQTEAVKKKDQNQ